MEENERCPMCNDLLDEDGCCEGCDDEWHGNDNMPHWEDMDYGWGDF